MDAAPRMAKPRTMPGPPHIQTGLCSTHGGRPRRAISPYIDLAVPPLRSIAQARAPRPSRKFRTQRSELIPSQSCSNGRSNWAVRTALSPIPDVIAVKAGGWPKQSPRAPVFLRAAAALPLWIGVREAGPPIGVQEARRRPPAWPPCGPVEPTIRQEPAQKWAWFKSRVFQVTVRTVPVPRRWKFFLPSDR